MAKLRRGVAVIFAGGALALSASAHARQDRQAALAENALIAEANTAMNAKQWQPEVDALDKLIALDPRWEYYQSLGTALIALNRYDEALAAYDKSLAGIDADTKSTAERTKPARALIWTNEGSALLKLKRTDDAIAAYTLAIKFAANPATAWFNLCALAYNQGKVDRAVTACSAAIAADPTRADAYFVKGSALYGNGTLDKNNRFVVPPGSVEALRKYLQLAPTGAHAADAQAMLDALKDPVKP